MHPYCFALSLGTCKTIWIAVSGGFWSSTVHERVKMNVQAATTYLDTHDSTDASMALVESHHLGQRIGEANIGVNNKDLAWIAF